MTPDSQYSLSGFDPRILELIPHRPPMLLISKLINVSANAACASVTITTHSPFYCQGLGVPSWIGLEYMGQTAALIGGHQQKLEAAKPQIGFLLGTRAYHTEHEYFSENCVLMIECQEKAAVGEGLAQFECRIFDASNTHASLATAKLSVFRKPATSLM